MAESREGWTWSRTHGTQTGLNSNSAEDIIKQYIRINHLIFDIKSIILKISIDLKCRYIMIKVFDMLYNADFKTVIANLPKKW